MRVNFSRSEGQLNVTDLCVQKRKLNFDLVESVAAYGQAVLDLSAQRGTLPKERYDLLKGQADTLRLRSTAARLALERHITQHGC